MRHERSVIFRAVFSPRATEHEQTRVDARAGDNIDIRCSNTVLEQSFNNWRFKLTEIAHLFNYDESARLTFRDRPRDRLDFGELSGRFDEKRRRFLFLNRS